METKGNSQTKPLSATPAVLLSLQNMSSTLSEPSLLSALTARKARVALALAQGTITAAAAAGRVHRVTVYRWLQTPEFAEAVRQARAAFILALREESKNLRAQALAAVDSLLTDPQLPTEERLCLAIAILNRPVLPLAARVRPDPLPTSENATKCNKVLTDVTQK